MHPNSEPRPPRRSLCLGAAAAALALLGGCNSMSRLNTVGEMPPMTNIQNPTGQPGYQPVSLPMPAPQVGERRPNSLWQAGTRAFFKDQRAANIGDILTVTIVINDKAQLQNESTRSRNNGETMGLTNFFGLENVVPRALGKSVTAGNLVNGASTTTNDGKGGVNRQEQINLRVATLVNQVLPNGNLVIIGKQEVRVNYEIRDLQITGVIRPQDISSTNEIAYDKIAEARISYGGRGQIMDVQQPRYGQQIYDIVSPF